MIRDLKKARTMKCPILFSMKRGSMGSIPHETVHMCEADSCQWWVPMEPGKGNCAVHLIVDLLRNIADYTAPVER